MHVLSEEAVTDDGTDEFIEESPSHFDEEQARSLPDESDSEVRVEFGIARAEVAARCAAIQVAEQLAAISATVREAKEFPEVFVGQRCRGESERQNVEFAVRAVIAELATALVVSQSTVRNQFEMAETMRMRLPRLWDAFGQGDVSYQNVRIVVEQADLLPDDADMLREFDDKLTSVASRLTPVILRQRARHLRERLNAESLTDRHAHAMEERRVSLEPEPDGMAWLLALLPADVALKAYNRIDAAARHLLHQSGEERTLHQLRADAAGDMLSGDGTAAEVRVNVNITVPVLTAMGESNEPGMLNGYGPIDAETARRMAAKAASFQRILTHPVTSAILDVDRASYQVPADLRRWLELRDGGCTFPGCNRPVERCDIDHITDWQYGGATSHDNLAHLCRRDHRLKHKTNWRLYRDGGGRLKWTTPTGATRETDPPPF